MKALLLLIFSFNVFAGEITCENGTCDPNIDSAELYSSEKLNDSFISIKAPTEKVSIKSGDKTSPRNLKIFIDENNGKGLDVDMTSTKIDNDAANTIIFSDYISNLNFKSNGKTGVDAKTASYKCAQKVLNGDLGEDIKQDFVNRRLNNPSIPSDRCVADDLAMVKNNQYSCLEGFEDNGGTNLKSTRWVKKRKCRGLTERKMCVEKKVKITCKWLAANINGCNSSPPPNFADVVWKYDPGFCSSTNSGFYADRPAVIKTETWLRDMRKQYSDKAICNIATDRLGYLNRHYKSSFVSVMTNSSYSQQETVTYDSTKTRMYLNMYYARWYGYTKNGRDVNYDTYMIPNMKFKKYIAHRGCWEGYSKHAYHLKGHMDRSCENPFNGNFSFYADTYNYIRSGTVSYTSKTQYGGGVWEVRKTACNTSLDNCDFQTVKRYGYDGGIYTFSYTHPVYCHHWAKAMELVDYECRSENSSSVLYSYHDRVGAVAFANPGKWANPGEEALTHHYNSGEHYKTGPSVLTCWGSGNSIPCRRIFYEWSQKKETTYLRSIDEYWVHPVYESTNRRETNFMGEAASAAWEVKFEVMAPTGDIIEVRQKRGEGCW